MKYDMEKPKETARDDSADAKRTLELINRLEIASKHDLNFAVQALAEVKTKHKEVDSKRKEFVDPLNKVVRGINDFFRPALTSLKTCESELKSKVVSYQEQQEAERNALIAEHKVEEAMEKLPESVEGLSTRTVRNVVVVNKLEAIKWCIDNARLDLVTLDVGSMLDLNVAGTEIKETKNVAVFAKKVRR